MRQDIETLRIISAFGIIWFHAGINPGWAESYAGLMVFIILSVFFTMQGSSSRSLYQRMERLLIPWAVWFVIYGLLNVITGNPFLESSGNLVMAILAGTKIHLWFLPFIGGVTLALVICKRLLSLSAMAITGVVVACVLICSLGWIKHYEFGRPFDQYVNALPAVFVGVFYGGFSALNRQMKILCLGLLIAALTLGYYVFYGKVNIAYLLSCLSCLLLLVPAGKIPFPFTVSAVSKLMFGVYLVHPLTLGVLRKLQVAEGALLPLAAFVMSLAAAYGITRILGRHARYAM